MTSFGEKEALYREFARLAVRRGVNVQPGQPLVIRSEVANRDFVVLCAEEAYAAGASQVIIDWSDAELSRLNYTYRTEEDLADIPQWVHDQLADEHEKKACYLRIASASPNAFDAVDAHKIRAYQMAYRRKTKDLQDYLTCNRGQWCVMALPSPEWAKVVFPELPEKEASQRLEAAILDASHVRTGEDAIENWKKHDAEIMGNAEWLTELALDAVEFTSGLGTKLTVPLVEDNIWVGGGSFTPEGVFFDPNIPTEECFSMPDRRRTEGVVYASRPLSYNGKLIDGFWFRFEKGRVVEYGAKQNEELLGQLLDFDEGSRSLGEVALVPYGSPIAQSGILFYNTLFDENAACHLALGRCYPENIRGGIDMPEEELNERGGNSSDQHVDFMFGTADMSVDGIRKDGSRVPIFRDGNFVTHD